MRPSVASALMTAAASGDAGQLAAMQRLRDELARAQDRIAELERLLGADLTPPEGLHLPPLPRRILGLLLARSGWVSRASIETVLYGDRPDSDWPEAPDRTVTVHMHHLRSVLDQFGIAIDTMRTGESCGYYLRPAMKTRLRHLMSSGPEGLSPSFEAAPFAPSRATRKRIPLQRAGECARQSMGGVT